MFIDIFGPRAKPCGDCIKFGDTWYCTMNCGPAVPPEIEIMPSKRNAPRTTFIRKADAEAIRDVMSMVYEGRPAPQGPEAHARYGQLQRLFGNIVKSLPVRITVKED